MTLPELVAAVGYVGVFLMVFIESGVPIGIILPLPGDTLLFSAGLLAASGAFDLVPLISVIIVAAILGDSAGYWFGAKYGPKMFEREGALFLNQRNLDRTVRFYERFGKLALVVARFLPVFRTIVPIFAGVGSMRYRDFLLWNVLGAFIWGISVPLLGYFLGSMIPNIDHYLLPILLVVILISSAGVAREWWQAKKDAEREQTKPAP